MVSPCIFSILFVMEIQAVFVVLDEKIFCQHIDCGIEEMLTKERIFFCSDRDESSAYERLSIPGGTFIQRLNYSPLEVMELGAIPDVLPASQKVEIGNFVL